MEGGTLVVPGHGRLTDAADVAYYRDMVTIMRDRVREAVKKGMTLPQIKAAKLTRDYDGRFGKDPSGHAGHVRRGDLQQPRSQDRNEDRCAPIRHCRLAALSALARSVSRSRQGRGQGARRRSAPPVARAAAPFDITGYWVSLVTDDWRYRMLTPPKGNADYLPVTLKRAA